MSRIKIIIGVVVAVIVLGLVIVFSHTDSVAGATTPSTSTAGYFTESMGSPLLILGGAVTGPNIGSFIQEAPSIGSCNTGTSTLFLVANPFSATSTVTVQTFSAQGNATTSTLLIGTTTKTTGQSVVSSDVSATMVNTTIATGTQAFTSSGITVGPGTGYTSAGAGTFRTIVLGPNESVAAYATSTATGAGAANYSPAFTSCTYKLRFTN